MAKIPKEVQEFFRGKLAWVSTVSSDGVPNATPKGSVRIIDDEHIIFSDLYSLKTRDNLTANPKVAITVIDAETVRGYQVKGTAELLDSGPLFEEMAEALKNSPKKRPPIQYVVRVSVDSVFDQSVGPDGGKTDRVAGLHGRPHTQARTSGRPHTT